MLLARFFEGTVKSDTSKAQNESDNSCFNLNPCVSTSHWLLNLTIPTTADRGSTPSQLPCLRVPTVKPRSICCSNTHTGRSVHPAAQPSIFTRTLAVSIHQTAGDGFWAIRPRLILVIYLGNILTMAREDKRWHWHEQANNQSHCHLFRLPLSRYWCTIF